MPTNLKTLSLTLLIALPLASTAIERISLLPPEAQTYVRVSNTTNFWSRLKQSSIGKLWADRQFQDFLGNPDSDIWQDLFFDEEDDAESEVLAEQLRMLKGEVILAFDMEMENPYIIAAMAKDDFLRSLEMDARLAEVSTEPFEIIKSTF